MQKFKFFYVREVVIQSKFVLQAAQRIDEITKDLASNITKGRWWNDIEGTEVHLTDGEELTRQAHSALIHGANIRKLLDPDDQAPNKRGGILREFFDIPSKAKFDWFEWDTREGRGDLEHFYERLDNWAEEMEQDQGEKFDFADCVVAPLDGTEVHSVRQERTFRQYDPLSGQFIFRGERFDLKSLVEEVQRLIQLAEQHNWQDRLMSGIRGYKRYSGLYGTMVAGITKDEVIQLVE